MMKQSHLRLAKELIEIKIGSKILTIDFEDGSGNTFIYTTVDNPGETKFIRLLNKVV
jgi:hypothetical protein